MVISLLLRTSVYRSLVIYLCILIHTKEARIGIGLKIYIKITKTPHTNFLMGG